MSALLGKAGKKLFERHLEQYAPQDPLYEFYTNDKGKKKRRKRALPPGLSARDAKILKSVQRRAHYLDKGFSILGFRFGWTFIIGLIPIVGDAADISMSYFLVVRKARQADLPPWLVRRMLFNNAVSAGVGFIPVAGDLILAIYKTNSRNAALLEEFLRIRGEEYLRLQEGGASTVNVESGGKKKRKGVSKKDAEQVKPGSGIVKGEVISTEPVATSSTSVVTADPSSEKKPPSESRRSFGSYFGRSNDTKAPPGDKSRFVEDIGALNGK
ncbi:hypothetical protein D9615_005714 [Tricholomella constricta]|uniref:Uncharacterized protein n=1 Tax=Tricholomella constricta TaxID=117010 RepID=A0A8H5M3A5_9AGAR|nr:hypothetical protein D9615_005714 [Tricholomella constricta]